MTKTWSSEAAIKIDLALDIIRPHFGIFDGFGLGLDLIILF